MNEPADQPRDPIPPAANPSEKITAESAAPAAPEATQVQRTIRTPGKNPKPKPDDRRDFFGDAMREALGPFAGIIERKINPFLAALEAIPNDVDRFTQVTLPALGRTLDQPQLGNPTSPANWPLDPAPAADVPLAFLHPPGALPPGDFENVCSRCGKCVQVCPASAIKMEPYQIAADGLPHIVAREQPCVVCDSLACMKECPTGALKLVDRFAIHLGLAKVDHALCLRDTGEDCRLCVEACPITGEGSNNGLDAIVIHAESGRVRVRRNACVGCGLCESRCPTEPAAIRVVPFKPMDPIVA